MSYRRRNISTLVCQDEFQSIKNIHFLFILITNSIYALVNVKVLVQFSNWFISQQMDEFKNLDALYSENWVCRVKQIGRD